MKEKVLEILKQEKRGFSVQEIFDRMGLKETKDFTELLKTLNELEDSLEIYHTKHDNYMLFQNCHLKLGTLLVNKKGFGFVDVDTDEDIYISEEHIGHAIHKDRVIVEIISPKGKPLEGRIIKIVDRKFKNMVGEFYYDGKIPKIHLDDEKVKIDLEIEKEYTLGAMDGHKVLVKVTKKLKDNHYLGRIIKILGHKNDPGVDILSIAYEHDINDIFSDDVMEETNKIPNEVLPNEYEGRKDLRDDLIFTIDGADTKDIDDAISIKKLDNGNYELGVHIADVSYYVKENSKLDDEAFERGTSVYLADRVIPMLPHKLSNGICSLNEGVDRLAMSCVMEIDDKGNIVNYDIFESVINSKKKMTYTCVNQILEENIIPEGYEPFVQSLKMMEELSSILRKNKQERGNIDFEIEEAKIIVNDKGEAIDVKLRERKTGEKLIEDFMIAANETVASHIYFMELPFVYRVHGEPSEEKISDFINFVKTLGYKVNVKAKGITPKLMQKLLEELKGKREFHILSSLLLRSMQKAVYDTTNIGHFGIASKCYTHFTSPIRRYPDTTVHRMLRKYLFEKKLDPDTIRYYEGKLKLIADHSSMKEREAVDCEREVDDMKKAEFMMKHIGEEYTGMINTVTTFGFFVELPNLVEGLVRVDDLTDDHYIFDEDAYALVGVRHKRRFRLGDVVTIIVKDANKEARTVDFILKEDEKKEETEISNIEYL